MSVKSDLLKKVPDYEQQQPHFLPLLDYIKRNRLITTEQLRKFLTTEMGLVETALAQDKRAGPAAVKKVRDNTIKLELLQKWQHLSKEYLS
ncbi:hypothetical protein HYU22_03170 [Candidatus Woesearchaeota archaeon]|nr:hypothetical protein [Candidatus Woesearchaeota archaeon]